MSVLSHVHQSSTLNSAKPPSIRCGGKTVHCNVLDARATSSDAGAHTSIDLEANATGAMAASAPSTTCGLQWHVRCLEEVYEGDHERPR